MCINNAETLKVPPTTNRMLTVFVMIGSWLKLPRKTWVIYSMNHANTHTHTH